MKTETAALEAICLIDEFFNYYALANSLLKHE